MPSLNKMSRSRPELDDAANFIKPPVAKTLEGPLTLYRFGGGSIHPRNKPDIAHGGARAGATQHGRWWYDRDLLNELKDDWIEANYNGGRFEKRNLLEGVRDGLAVAKNWSNFSWFCRLKLLAGDELLCFIGRASPKPVISTKADSPLFMGGATQYLIYDLHLIPPDRITITPTTSIWMEIGKTDDFMLGH